MAITRKVVTTTKEEIEEHHDEIKITDIPTNYKGTLLETSPARTNVTGENLLMPKDNGGDTAPTSNILPTIGRSYADIIHEVIHSGTLHPFIVVLLYIISLFSVIKDMKNFSWVTFGYSLVVGTSLNIIFFIASSTRQWWTKHKRKKNC